MSKVQGIDISGVVYKRELLTPNQISYIKEKKLVDTLSEEEFYDYIYSIGYYDTDDFMDIFLYEWKVHQLTGEYVPS